jgi:hypothetical protein
MSRIVIRGSFFAGFMRSSCVCRCRSLPGSPSLLYFHLREFESASSVVSPDRRRCFGTHALCASVTSLDRLAPSARSASDGSSGANCEEMFNLFGQHRATVGFSVERQHPKRDSIIAKQTRNHQLLRTYNCLLYCSRKSSCVSTFCGKQSMQITT